MEKINGWKRIDPHVHSKGISKCSHVTCEEIIDEKIALGYEGVVLTNHCQAWYYEESKHKDWCEEVIAEYERGRKYADEKDFRFILGLEVTIGDPAYSDWLLYGVTEQFLRESPCLYKLSQKQLFELCKKYGIVLVQAHPLRQQLLDPAYMHGIEINCTPGDLEKREMIESLAKEYGLLVACGTDYHFVEKTYRGGILIPDSVTNGEELAAYFRSAEETKVFTGDRLETYPILSEIWEK